MNMAGVLILGAHILQIIWLGPSRWGGNVSEFLRVSSAGLAAVACWQAARRAHGASRPFWLILGAALAAALAAAASWTYLLDWLGLTTSSVVWTRNVSLLRTLLLTVLVMREPSSERLGLEDLLDLIQVVIVYVLSYLLVSYNTTSSLEAEGLSLQFLPRALILLIALVQIGRWRNSPTADLQKGLLVYLAFYLFGEGWARYYSLDTRSFPPGSWPELVWTVSPVGVTWWAARWTQKPDVEQKRITSLTDLLLASTPFALMPLVALLQAGQLGDSYHTARYALLATSFLCFAARLGLSEFRQSQQMASILARDRRLQATHDELQIQTTLLEQLFRTAPEAIAVLDTNQHVLRVNAEFTRLFGFSQSRVLGRQLDDLLSIEKSDLAPEPDAAGNTSFDAICRTTAGEKIDVSVLTSNVLLPTGEKITFWICRDIRERKQAEARLLQSQKMEAIGLLAGGVAHDFNNILTVINGFSALVLKDLPPGTVRDRISLIQKAGEQAAQVTEQLLAFSRKQMIQPQVLSLDALILDSRSMYQGLLGEDVTLTVTCGGCDSIIADPGQVNQILINLLVNARDAMPRGGTIRIETSHQARFVHSGSSGESGGPRAVLTVTDAGTGIDPALRSRIFEPFFTTKEMGRGTGLGLATVYGIVQQLGGSVAFTSELGRGTTFELLFPEAGAASLPSGIPPQEPNSPAATRSILVVEDQDHVREFICDVLVSAGYRVFPCSRAEDSYSVAAENPSRLDLLLTDVVLPGLSGPELAMRLRKSRPKLKVLLMSGYPGSVLGERGVLAQETSILLKPFTPDELLTRVGGVLEARGVA